MVKFSTADIRLFKWESLHIFEYKDEIEFESIKYFIKTQEFSLQLVKEEFRKNIRADNTYKSLSGKQQSDYFEQEYGKSINSIKEMDRLQKYTIIQLLLSVLESRFKDICILSKSEFKLKKFNDDFSIPGYWDYLKEEVQIESSSLIKNYSKIDDLRKIRNRIIHHNGILSDSTITIADTTDGLSYNSSHSAKTLIIENKEYLHNQLKTVETFFSELYKQLDIKYTEIKGN